MNPRSEAFVVTSSEAVAVVVVVGLPTVYGPARRNNICDLFPCCRTCFKTGFTSLMFLLILTPFVYNTVATLLSSFGLVMGDKLSRFGAWKSSFCWLYWLYNALFSPVSTNSCRLGVEVLRDGDKWTVCSSATGGERVCRLSTVGFNFVSFFPVQPEIPI